MIGLATTRGALITGTTTDEFGDEMPDDTPVDGWSDFPLSLIQKTRRVQDPDSGMWRAIAYLVAQVPLTLPVTPGDRLLDRRSGIMYQITDETVIPRGISGMSSRTLEVSQTSA